VRRRGDSRKAVRSRGADPESARGSPTGPWRGQGGGGATAGKVVREGRRIRLSRRVPRS